MPILFADRFAETFVNPSAAYSTTKTFFVAPFDCVISNITEVHSVLGTDASAVNVNLTHETGTQAPGAGAVLLSNNSNAGFNLKAVINTPQNATFKAGSSRKLLKGDRLAVKFSGVQTAVDGLTITVVFRKWQA